MRLLVYTPDEHVFDAPVVKVVAEATNGSFGMLERHIDMVAPLTSGVLEFQGEDGETGYLGLDEGILVKCGGTVSVATRRAVRGGSLADLRRLVEEEFLVFDEEELIARRALARLETGVVRRMLELERRP
jgi:F-type H+-transporting ATPase subunit epsilon